MSELTMCVFKVSIMCVYMCICNKIHRKMCDVTCVHIYVYLCVSTWFIYVFLLFILTVILFLGIYCCPTYINHYVCIKLIVARNTWMNTFRCVHADMYLLHHLFWMIPGNTNNKTDVYICMCSYTTAQLPLSHNKKKTNKIMPHGNTSATTHTFVVEHHNISTIYNVC